MAQPIALCIERLEAPGERFTSCVALVGREPGLSLGEEAEIQWRRDGDGAIRLCVAQDGRLVLLREEGAPAVTLLRGGRSLAVPEEKPVFVIDQDELALGRGPRLRLHVHGVTAEVRAPRPVVVTAEPEPRAEAPRWLLATAAALALGATAGGFGVGGGQAAAPEAGPSGTDAARRRPDGGPTPASQPIVVREHPPVDVPPPRPPRSGCGGCSKQDDPPETAMKK